MIRFDNDPKPIKEAGLMSRINASVMDNQESLLDKFKDAEGAEEKLQVVKTGAEGAEKTVNSIDQNIDKHRVRNNSIVARASKSILQFPIYVTQTLRTNEAHIISKQFERVYASLVQTAIAQNPIITDDLANDLGFLKKFHTNIKEAAEVLVNKYYEPIDDMDAIMKESVFYHQVINERCEVTFSVIPTMDQEIILENARLANEPLTGFSYLKEDGEKDITTDKTSKSDMKWDTVSESELRNMAMNEIDLSSEDKKLLDMTNKDIETDVNTRRQSSYPKKPASNASKADKKAYSDACDQWKETTRNEIESKIQKRDEIEDKVNKSLDELKSNIKSGKYNNKENGNFAYVHGRFVKLNNSTSTTTKTLEKDKQPSEPKTAPVERAVDVPTILRDSDIKKLNGMLPYEIAATFLIKNSEGSGINKEVRYIIGIKTILHLVRTQDIAEDIHELVTGNIHSLQKVRYKSGEIGFLDYFLNLKGIKADAAKKINYNKRWINTLKRNAEYSKLAGSLLNTPAKLINGGDVPIPNGTLILTQTDVTSIIKQTGIDLSNVSNAKRLAKSLFLIGIAIIDSSAGTIKVIFPDADSNWDVQSLASIDAELSKTDNSKLMSELNKLVNK